MSKTLKIYWSPANFPMGTQQWNFLFHEPIPVSESLTSNLTDQAPMIKCPALRNSLKNVFALQSMIDDSADLSGIDFDYLAQPGRNEPLELNVKSKISLFSPRSSSIEGHVNLNYNLSWLFFSEEPLIAKMRAPFFPATSPMEGAFLAPGSFDIGQWFRPFNIDYHVPTTVNSFNVTAGQPLAFVEFDTDRRIEFVRFQLTKQLGELSDEFSASASRYGKGIPLLERYRMAKRSGIMKLIRHEVLNNVVS